MWELVCGGEVGGRVESKVYHRHHTTFRDADVTNAGVL